MLALRWPESGSEPDRNALRRALHYLRRSLGSDATASRGEGAGAHHTALNPKLAKWQATRSP